MRFNFIFAAALISLFMHQPAAAQALAAIQQIGVAEFSSLRRSFYIAGLAAEHSDSSQQELLTTGGQAKRLDIKVIADNYSQRRFSQQWSQSLIVSATQEQLLAFDEALVNFQNLLDEPFQQGDIISIEADKSGASAVYLNSVKAFDVKKPGFLELLLTTWIGSKPPSTAFKQSILTGSAPEDIKQKFAELQPDPTRIAATKSALEKKTKQSQPVDKPVLVDSQEALIATAKAPQKPSKPAQKTSTAPKPTPQKASNNTAAPVVAKTPAKSQQQLQRETAEENEAIDPAIYLEQQHTLQKLYATSASRAIQQQVNYPNRAIKLQQQGVVKIEIAVDREGQIASMRLVEEAKYKSLNRAALKAVEEAGQLRAIPAAIDADYITFVVPFQFALRQ